MDGFGLPLNSNGRRRRWAHGGLWRRSQTRMAKTLRPKKLGTLLFPQIPQALFILFWQFVQEVLGRDEEMESVCF